MTAMFLDSVLGKERQFFEILHPLIIPPPNSVVYFEDWVEPLVVEAAATNGILVNRKPFAAAIKGLSPASGAGNLGKKYHPRAHRKSLI